MPLHQRRYIPKPEQALSQGSTAKRPGLPDAIAQHSRLSAMFPTAWPLQGSFDEIAIPGGFTVSGNEAAWYPLINVSAEELGQELTLNGFYVDLLSCDHTADGTTYAAWGDGRGLGAAIVIGRNLPVVNGQWTKAVPWFAGVQSGVKLVSSEHQRRSFVRSFPPGAYASSYQKRAVNGTWVPWVVRVTRRDRICAALVVRGSQVQTGAGKILRGYGHVELHVGETRPSTDLQSLVAA